MNAPFRASPFISRGIFVFLAGAVCLIGWQRSAVAVGPQRQTGAPAELPAEHPPAQQTACQGPDCPAVQPVVAVLLPLSGPFSHLGQQARGALTLALASVDSVRLEFFDTQGTQAGARKAAADAIELRPAFMAGGLGDRETAEIWAAASRAGIPFITPGRASLVGGRPLQTAVSREGLDSALLDAVAAQGAPECAFVIRRSDPFGDAELTAFKAALAARSIPLVAAMSMASTARASEEDGQEAGSDDEGDFAARVAAAASDFRSRRPCSRAMLHLVMDITAARRLVDYLRFAGFFDLPGWSVTMTGTALFDAPGMVAQGGASLKGLMFVDVDVQSSFGDRGNDPFKAELEDFAAFTALVAADAGSRYKPGDWSIPEGLSIQGRTGTLSLRGGQISGHRLKACRVTGRGIECSTIELPQPAPENTAVGDKK